MYLELELCAHPHRSFCAGRFARYCCLLVERLCYGQSSGKLKKRVPDSVGGDEAAADGSNGQTTLHSMARMSQRQCTWSWRKAVQVKRILLQPNKKCQASAGLTLSPRYLCDPSSAVDGAGQV